MSGQIQLSFATLGHLLNQHLPVGQAVDFLNIDVEGMDFDVLQSNDWGKYRPQIVAVEDLAPLVEIGQSETAKFLAAVKYEFIAKTMNTCFFVRKE